MINENKKEYLKEYHKTHIEQARIYQKKYYYSKKGQAKLVSVRASNLKMKILEKLGDRCVHCGFDDPRALQIDHIAGGGKKDIKSFNNNHRSYYRSILENKIPNKYQILCANCNWIKRYENRECKNDLPPESSSPL